MMVEHAKETALLEVTLGKERLREVFCDYTKSIADTVYIEDKMLGNMPTSNLLEGNVINLAAYCCIQEFLEEEVDIFGFQADQGAIVTASANGAATMIVEASKNNSISGKDKLAEKYCTLEDFDLAATGRKCEDTDEVRMARIQ